MSHLFSILIANYNNGSYLQETINSILAQTYSNWEIILVDDKSTDESSKIYEKYKSDRRFFFHYNEKNMGCGYTKRKCIELAHGEICGFVDADDSITPNALEIMVDAHIKHPLCSLIYSQFYYTDNELNVQSISQHQCSIPNGSTYLTCNIPGAISHFASFKKKYYEETIGIDSTLKIAEDLDLYLKLEEVGKLLFIPTPLYYYRTGTGTNTSLGKANYLQSTNFEFIARINAYVRRQIPIESILLSKLNSLYNEAFSDGQNNIRETKTYKIGHTIIAPLRLINKILSK